MGRRSLCALLSVCSWTEAQGSAGDGSIHKCFEVDSFKLFWTDPLSGMSEL